MLTVWRRPSPARGPVPMMTRFCWSVWLRGRSEGRKGWRRPWRDRGSLTRPSATLTGWTARWKSSPPSAAAAERDIHRKWRRRKRNQPKRRWQTLIQTPGGKRKRRRRKMRRWTERCLKIFLSIFLCVVIQVVAYVCLFFFVLTGIGWGIKNSSNKWGTVWSCVSDVC